jgi:hypothetical protein
MSETVREGVGVAATTARVLVHPSASVPGAPAFVFSAPEGWVVDEAPDAICVVRSPEQVDDFWLNAVISHDRVARTVDLEQAAKATWARIVAESPSASVNMERIARFGDNVVYLRGVQLDAPKSGRPLAQLHALFFAPAAEGRATSDLFQIIATSPTTVMGDIGAGLVEMIASFRFV